MVRGMHGICGRGRGYVCGRGHAWMGVVAGGHVCRRDGHRSRQHVGCMCIQLKCILIFKTILCMTTMSTARGGGARHIKKYQRHKNPKF